jgi:hypothetical protein
MKNDTRRKKIITALISPSLKGVKKIHFKQNTVGVGERVKEKNSKQI